MDDTDHQDERHSAPQAVTRERDMARQTRAIQRQYGLLAGELLGATAHDRWVSAIASARLIEMAAWLADRRCGHPGSRCWSCRPMVIAVTGARRPVYATFQSNPGPQ